MARNPIELPFFRGEPSGIIQMAGAEKDGAVCPGKVSPGCLVPFNLRVTVDNAVTLANPARAVLDPNQSALPILLQCDANADLTFQIESGETGKTINAEGTGISGIYTPGDFTAARLFAQQNPLPGTGPVSRERPLAFLLANADAMNDETLVGTLLAIATDKKGRVPEAALRYYLSRLSKMRPDVIQLCAHGYRSIGGGWAESQPACDGQFPPGSIVPLKLNTFTLATGVNDALFIGPLQPMVPLFMDLAATAGVSMAIIDPQTGKDARVQGGPLAAVPLAAGATGSMLSPNFLATRFVSANFQASVNAMPWTSLSIMSRERPLELRCNGAMGDVVNGFVWAIVLDKDEQVPEAAWWYANMLYGGVPAAA